MPSFYFWISADPIGRAQRPMMFIAA